MHPQPEQPTLSGEDVAQIIGHLTMENALLRRRVAELEAQRNGQVEVPEAQTT